MRLLQFKDDKLNLVKFAHDQIPQYAILSHTWGREGDELSFSDVNDTKGKDKSGYQKIQFCGERAAKDNLDYFWVDTCCIDKSNKSEEDEAIRSMFQWYSKAAKCYVYLSDVPEGGSEIADEPPGWEPSFLKSRWFTRGWTLQELIAPSSVEFFAANGIRLGDRRSLEQQIVQVTGLPAAALQVDINKGDVHQYLSQFSIEDRLAWGNKRQTTRAEDLAYSLQGICGVFIPTMYGEGRDYALRRLRREIKSDQSKLQSNFLPHPYFENRRCRTATFPSSIRWITVPLVLSALTSANSFEEFASKKRSPFLRPRVPSAEAVNRFKRLIKLRSNKNHLYILLLGLLVATGVIIGTSVGITVGKRTRRLLPVGSIADSNIMANSSLASVNWTDTTGNQHYYVLFQDTKSNLLCSIYTSENKAWLTTNISAAIAFNTTAGTNLRAGTALAAVAHFNHAINSFEMSVYAMAKNNNIVEFTTLDHQGGSTWRQVFLGQPFPLVAAKESRLAAHRPDCGVNCTFPTVIVYQNLAQSLCFSSSSNWAERITQEQDVGNFFSPQTATGLSLVSVAQNRNVTNISWKVYYVRSGTTLQEMSLHWDLSIWGINGAPASISHVTVANYAAVCFNLLYILLANINDDGLVIARYWNNFSWSSSKAPTLNRIPNSLTTDSRYTAISMHADCKVYTIVGGALYQWSFDESAPSTWNFVDRIQTNITGK